MLPPPPRAGLGNTFKRPIVNFTIPSTAGVNQARTVIASVLPPPLDTYIVPPFGVKYRSGIIYYGNGDDTSYIYDCVVNTASAVTVARHVGMVLHGVVLEHTISAAQRPLVQGWINGNGFISHKFDSDLFTITTGGDPVLRQFSMDVNTGISLASGGDAAPLSIGADGPVSISTLTGGLSLRTNGSDINITVNNITNNLVLSLGGMLVNGRSVGLGMGAHISAVANSAAIAGEAVVLTTPAMTFKAGRAYAVTYRGSVFPNTANTFHFIRVRKTNLAGALLSNLAQISTPAIGAQQTVYDRILIRRNAGTDLVGVVLALTSQHSAGTGTWTGGVNDIRYFEAEDIGVSADYPNAVAIV
jgi:hypothetical protein